ncbi:homeobox and leucine zipper encoding b [Conger conger]|uniref:homeobox and leucine zipper encoding b n=1 Tax=Conger conger TaxID=82655 RepID=UPI002A59D345|nr:homeobox and leucine zipper encoding b [Conger conger]
MESSSPPPQTETLGPRDPPRREWPEEEQEEEEEGSAEEGEDQEKMERGGRAEEEEEKAGGGYACRICGFHAADVRTLSLHLHTLHPVAQQQPVTQEGGSLSMATVGDPGDGTCGEREEAGPREGGAGPREGGAGPEGISPDSDCGGHNRTKLVCLPLVADGLKLVWTRSDQTRELDGVPPLVQAFNAFPYPSPGELAGLARGCGLPLDSVRVWFMVQRVRYGISWAAEEIEETRRKLAALHRREEEEEEEEEGEEMGTYSPKFWGSGDDQRGFGGAGQGGGVMGGAMRDFLFRRTRPFYMSWRGGRRPLALRPGLDPAPSPLFVVAAPGGRGRKSRLQLRALRRSFVRDNWLSEAELRRLQQETGLSRGEVRKWFSDSRYQLRHNGHRPPPPGQEVTSGGVAEDSLLEVSVEEEEEPAVSVETEVPADPPAESPGAPRSPGEPGVLAEGGGERQEGALLLIGDGLDPSSAGPLLLTSRGRLRKTKEQLAVLKQFFLRCQWPTSDDYTRLVQRTALPRPDVIQWFGDARYRVKNGNLRWVRAKREHAQIVAHIAHGDRRRAGEGGARGGEAEPAPEKAPPPADVRPLELFWRRMGAEPGEGDVSALSRQSGMSPRDVRDWFSCQQSGMAEVEVNISD